MNWNSIVTFIASRIASAAARVLSPRRILTALGIMVGLAGCAEDGPDPCCINPAPDYDLDDDGFDSDATNGGGDCDDNDSKIYPGAEEVCDDAIDQDCDGFDLTWDEDNRACETPVKVRDLDDDGFDAPLDCDDSSPGVYPGAPENACPDGADQDCDGTDGDPTVDCGDAGMMDASMMDAGMMDAGENSDAG